MTEAHQNRIKQLRDSFNQKMFEAENWPKEVRDFSYSYLNQHKNHLHMSSPFCSRRSYGERSDK